MPTFSEEKLRKLGVTMFLAAGASNEQAETVTEILVDTSLMGIDSHGVRALPGYIRTLKKGRIQPDGKTVILKDSLTTAFWDGGPQFGHVVAKRAMETAIEKARTYHMGWVSTVSEHIGALYYYSLMAARNDMIGIVTCRTNTMGGNITPFNGREGRFGTNPISISIPAAQENPIVLDIATSMVAYGHIAVMAARGQKVPEGWILDKEGNPTTNPMDYLTGGMMVPFGTYKGYGLSVIVAALPMFPPGVGLEQEDKPYPWGHTFMALDPEGFMPIQTYKERTDALIQYIKSCPPLPGREVLMPFEREWRVREKRLNEGIFVDEPFWKDFQKIGTEIGIDVDKEMN